MNPHKRQNPSQGMEGQLPSGGNAPKRFHAGKSSDSRDDGNGAWHPNHESASEEEEENVDHIDDDYGCSLLYDLQVAPVAGRLAFSEENDDEQGQDELEVGDELQRKAIQLATSGQNLFLTGKAGTGKSWTTKKIVDSFLEDNKIIHVTAPTGIAAINVDGITIHSWGRFRLGEYYEDFNNMMSDETMDKIRKADALLIDEISMLDGQLFDVLECMISIIRCYNDAKDRLVRIKDISGSGNTIMSTYMLQMRWRTGNNGLRDIPAWGGLQLIVVGDFYQLPPVPAGSDVLIANSELVEKDSHLKVGRQGCYAFESHAWHRSEFEAVELIEVHRQAGDDELFEFLNAMREGETDIATKHSSALSLLKAPLPKRSDGIVPTELHSTNREVNKINQRELSKLINDSYDFESMDEVEFSDEYKSKLLKRHNLEQFAHMPYLFSIVEKPLLSPALVEAQAKLKSIDDGMTNAMSHDELQPLTSEKNELLREIERIVIEEKKKSVIGVSSFTSLINQSGLDPRTIEVQATELYNRYKSFSAQLKEDYEILRQHFQDNFFNKQCRASSHIELKKDAQVLLLWNVDLRAKLANGSRGVVRGFIPSIGYYKLLRRAMRKRNEAGSDEDSSEEDAEPNEIANFDFNLVKEIDSIDSYINDADNSAASKGSRKREEDDHFDFSSVDPKFIEEIEDFLTRVPEHFLEREIHDMEKVLISNIVDLPYIHFANGKKRLIRPQPFAKTVKGCGTGTRWQIPLTLAWAISIHKSQGMTIEWLHVDLVDCFEKGQAYVACSRGKSLSSMTVKNFNPYEVKTSDKVKKFYNSLNGGAQYTETWSETIAAFDRETKQKMKRLQDMESEYRGTLCKQCGTQCVVRQTQTNKNNNRGMWYLKCPIGDSKGGHTFTFLGENLPRQKTSSSKQSLMSLKPGDNGAIKDILKGKKFVPTGVFPELGGGEGLALGKDKLKEMIVSFGGVMTGSISGKTDYIIVGEEPGAKKLEAAKSRGITTLDIRTVKMIIMGKSDFPATKTLA